MARYAEHGEEPRKIKKVGSYVYYGYANKGYSTSDAEWAIKRLFIEEDGDDVEVTETWVDGLKLKTSIWDNYSTLTYSEEK